MHRPHSLAWVAAAAGAVAALITAPLAGAEAGNGCDTVDTEAVNGGQFTTCTTAGNQLGANVGNPARSGCDTTPSEAVVGGVTACTVTNGDAELVAAPNDSAENAGELQNPFGQSQSINPDEPETG